MNPFLQEILAPIATVAVTITTPVVVAAAVQLFRKLGVDIEAKNREALQSALENAAITAIAQAGGKMPTQTAPKKQAIDTAIDYVEKSVPGAVKKFSLDQRKIKELLEPHLAKAVNKVEK